jgi:DNA invertase Pin-like site-specific DNA recombinase/DNA-directed RNA polymerase subunit RPC12/RpoP
MIGLSINVFYPVVYIFSIHTKQVFSIIQFIRGGNTVTNFKGLTICRVSTSEQKQGTSLDSQSEWCKSKSQEIGVEIVEEIKLDISGIKFPKEYYDKILKIVDDKKISHLFVYSIDRLSRSIPYGSILIKKLWEKNVKIVTRAFTPDKTKHNDKMQVWMTLLFAEMEHGGIHERTKRGISHMLKDGKWPLPPPFGYEKLDCKLIIIDGYNKIIEFVFNTFISTKCYAKTARLTEIKFEEIINKKLSGSDVKNIVTNKVYTGFLEWGGNIFGENGSKKPGENLKMIEQEVFEKAQKIVKDIELKHCKGNVNPKNFLDLIEEYSYEEILKASDNLAVICSICGSVNLQKNGGDIQNGGWVQKYICISCKHQFRFPSAKQLKSIKSLNPLRCMRCGISDDFNVEKSQLTDYLEITCNKCGYMVLVDKKSSLFPNFSDSHM